MTDADEPPSVPTPSVAAVVVFNPVVNLLAYSPTRQSISKPWNGTPASVREG
jgi:hypothetical protein